MREGGDLGQLSAERPVTKVGNSAAEKEGTENVPE